jgi:hypothetical protein
VPRGQVRLFLLVGMRTRDLLRLMVLHGVDPVFWHRGLYALYVSLLQSLFYAPIEDAAYPPLQAIDEGVPILYPPIFILGHYRSGTSLLHELLYTSDPSRLCAPTSFMCFAPRVFLTRLPFVRKVRQQALPNCFLGQRIYIHQECPNLYIAMCILFTSERYIVRTLITHVVMASYHAPPLPLPC